MLQSPDLIRSGIKRLAVASEKKNEVYYYYELWAYFY